MTEETKRTHTKMLDEGLSYAQMAAQGYAPIEYKAYQMKVRKQPFKYVVMPLADIEETCKIIEGLRAELERAAPPRPAMPEGEGETP